MEPSTGQLAQGLSPSGTGVGPLLQRDYWAVLPGARLRPSELLAHLRAHFQSFAPDELAAFEVRAGRPLQVGDELSIEIFGAGRCAVRVVHQDAQSLTLATLEGHPEAGRITFGAYRSEAGEVIFHIRSRARSDSLLRLFGFVVAGEAMQTNTWSQFISRVGALAGAAIEGVQAKLETLDEEEEDDETGPTFLARGD